MKRRLLSLCWPALSLAGQDAAVTGRIQPSSGAPIDRARVSLTNDATGVRRVGWSNADGYYAIVGAEPGVYNVTVRREQFQTTSRMGIKLDVGASRYCFRHIWVGPVRWSNRHCRRSRRGGVRRR